MGDDTLFALALTILIPLIIIGIGLLVLYIVGYVKLFKKAGRDGWEAIIPFYNDWVLVEISELSWWWFLIIIAPTIANIINSNLTSLSILAALFGKFCCFYNISKKLHKDTSVAILTTVFPIVMIPIIGLSKDYQFDKSVPVSENGPFESTPKPKQQEEKNPYFCPKCGKEIKKDSKYCMHCGEKLE